MGRTFRLASLVTLSILTAGLVACSAATTGEPSPGGGDPTVGGGDGTQQPGSGTGSGATPGGGGTTGGGTTGGGTGGGTGVAATTISADTTWSGTKTLASSIVIAAGATVTVAPGAVITLPANALITVQGTLQSTITGVHAKLTSSAWSGILVASGGKLALSGTDIVGAGTGIESMSPNATFANGAITGSAQPLLVDVGGTLSLTHAQVVAAGQSVVKGALIASFLDYDKGGNEGIVTQDASASVSIEDSTLHGAGGGDYIVADAGKLIHVAYTKISGAHCGFHFNAVDKYEIDHVTDNTNTWGAMLYGSGLGPNTISYSNFVNTSWNLDLQGTNGPLTIDHSYIGGTAQTAYKGAAPTITNVQTAAVPNAGPRAGG